MTFRHINGSARTRPQPPQCSAKLAYIENAEPEEARELMEIRRCSKSIRRHPDPTCCSRGATVEIDGKPYCATHAGAIALDRMLARDDATEDRFTGIDRRAGNRPTRYAESA